ncbi:MAG TPA: helix-turn-helix transcriptional regulator [Chloroflexota bacterium]|nr:helix-turn-helix transcriptional regulator [Chloroflexota bacterium]
MTVVTVTSSATVVAAMNEGVASSEVPRKALASLAGALRAKRISQRQIGQELGVTDPTVSRWLSGEIPIPGHALVHIARRVEASIDDLTEQPRVAMTGNVSGVIGQRREQRGANGQLAVYDGLGAAAALSGLDNLPDPIDHRDAPEGYEDVLGPHGIGMRVRGESMAGGLRRPILDGDIAWFNPRLPCRSRGVMAAVVREAEDSEPKSVVKFHDGDGGLFSLPATGLRVPFPVYEILAMVRVVVLTSPPGEP